MKNLKHLKIRKTSVRRKALQPKKKIWKKAMKLQSVKNSHEKILWREQNLMIFLVQKDSHALNAKTMIHKSLVEQSKRKVLLSLKLFLRHLAKMKTRIRMNSEDSSFP